MTDFQFISHEFSYGCFISIEVSHTFPPIRFSVSAYNTYKAYAYRRCINSLHSAGGHVEQLQGQSHAQTLKTWLSSSTTQQLIRKPTKNRKVYIETYIKAQQVEGKANYKLRGVENFEAQVADQQQLKPT